MRSHHLLRLDDNKSAASCQTGLQVDSQDVLSSAIGASEYFRNPGLFFVLVLGLSKSRNGFKTKVTLGELGRRKHSHWRCLS